MSFEHLLVIGMGIWRLTRLLVEEGGPWNIFLNFRKKIGIAHDDAGLGVAYENGYLPDLFSCVFCMSLNLSVIVFVIWLFFPAEVVLVMTPFAIGTLALIARKLTN